jgi:hypothetical protein
MRYKGGDGVRVAMKGVELTGGHLTGEGNRLLVKHGRERQDQADELEPFSRDCQS